MHSIEPFGAPESTNAEGGRAGQRRHDRRSCAPGIASRAPLAGPLGASGPRDGGAVRDRHCHSSSSRTGRRRRSRPRSRRRPSASPASSIAPPPSSTPDMSLLARPLPPRALALGVRRVVLDAGHGGAHQRHRQRHRPAGKRRHARPREARAAVAGRPRLRGRPDADRRPTRCRSNSGRPTANQQRGDIFVSIHLNSFEPATARGVETFYLGPSEHPDHDAVAAAENQHSGYSLADLRTLLDGIYVDARRDESKRLAQSVQDADDAASAPRPIRRWTIAASRPRRLSCSSPPTCPRSSRKSPACPTPTRRNGLARHDHRQTIAEALVNGIQAFSKQQTHSAGKRKDTNER